MPCMHNVRHAFKNASYLRSSDEGSKIRRTSAHLQYAIHTLVALVLEISYLAYGMAKGRATERGLDFGLGDGTGIEAWAMAWAFI